MKKLVAALLLSLVSIHASLAAEQPATDASLKRLMDVMQAKKLVDGTMSQMDSYLQGFMKQATGGKAPTAEQEAVLADMRRRMVALTQSEMKWEKLEPIFMEIYKKSFTEQEVLGMIEFYNSPTGRAVIMKMPAVMQHSMELMQRLMVAMMPKMKQIEEDTASKLRQCCKSGG